MKIALAQFDVHWEQPIANLELVKSMVPSDVDLCVLPEMFLTGFTMNPSGVAESMSSRNLAALQAIVDEKETGIIGSLVVSEDSNIFNRMILFTPRAPMQYYDKRHLFGYGGEDRMYTAGSNDGIFQFGDWTICARICYDLRFPVWSRNTMDYDLLIYVANWPKARHHAWRSLIQSRAIENQAYCIGVNRIGRDANDLEYLGGSMAVNYNGDIILDAGNSSEVVTVSIPLQEQKTYREKLPFLKDQDRFTIHG